MTTLSTQDDVITVDGGTRKILSAGSSVASLLQQSLDGIIGKELWEVGVLESREQVDEIFGACASRGLQRIEECEIRRDRGSTAYVELTVVAAVANKPAFQVHVLDLTLRKQMDHEVQQVLNSARCLLWQAEVVRQGDEYVWTPEIRNPAAAVALLGLTGIGDEELWHAFLESKLPNEIERQDAASTTALATGQSEYQQEFRVQTKDGNILWLFEDVQITSLAEGRWCLTGLCTNISARKRAEECARLSEIHKSAVFTAALDCVITMDEGGLITGFNPAAETAFGYKQEEVLGRLLGDVIIPLELRSRHENALKRYLQTGETSLLNRRVELDAVRADGTHFPVELTIVATLIDGQTIFTGYVRDITERKQAEDALRESESGYRSMFTSNPHPMWVFDVDTLAFLAVNSAAIAHYGFSEEEFLSMTIKDIRPEEDVQNMLADRSKSHASERREGLWRHRKKDGEILYVEIASHPILWEGVQARVVLANDVSERKLVEDRLLAAQAELESRVHDRTAEVRRANVALQNEISERRQAEEELRLSEARYRAIVEDQTEMICRFTADGTFTFVNGAHCRYFQQPPEQLLGTTFFRFLSPEDAEWTKSRLSSLGPNNPVATYENEMILPGGEVRWQQWTDRYLVDEQGAFVSFQSVGRDITERKLVELELQRAKEEAEKANEELTRNEARLLRGNTIFTELTRMRVSSREELEEALAQITEAGSLLLDIDRCSIWLYDENESHIDCVDLYERPLDRHSAVGQLSVQDFPNYFNHLQTRRSIVAHDAHTHAATFEFSKPYLTPLGISSMLDVPIIIGGRMVGVLCCEQIGQPRRWHVEEQTMANSASSICSVAIESYERARVEEALREARDEAEMARSEAENANKAKSDFLSRMSHELRTPLNAILGFGQILEQHDLSEVQRESVQYVLKGGRHLLGLINEVLDISRVEAGRLELSMEPVDLARLIPESCSLVGPLADAREIQLDPQMAELGYHVMADHQRLRQVIFNLLSNAIKYNRHGGRVTISGQVLEGERFRIAVHDTGYGISQKDLRKLFTPFERLRATSSEIEGTGLGLAVSQRLVTAMAGNMSVESVEGKGSTFFVEFPLATSPIEKVADIAGKALHLEDCTPSNRVRTILYIEDNSSNLRLLEVFFEGRASERLLSASDGATGLDLARQVEPDLILLDLHLPELSGVEVLDRLQRSGLTSDIPVVIISADATPAQIELLLKQGAQAFLTKPLDLTLLSSTLDNILYDA